MPTFSRRKFLSRTVPATLGTTIGLSGARALAGPEPVSGDKKMKIVIVGAHPDDHGKMVIFRGMESGYAFAEAFVRHVRSICLFLLLLFIYPYDSHAQNPIITHMYTADPSARVFHDTLYLYPSHDGDTATWFNMADWHVFSTTDMKHWTDHGVALSLKDLKWGFKFAWAPDCAYKNGKYYFYYPVAQNYIGVAVGDKPYGPFTDPLGKPLITRQTPGVVNNRDLIDPAIFIDDDGTAYLIFGQNDVNIVKLHNDMISFSDTVRVLKGTDHFFEAVWMHKYNGKYYLSYSGDGKILYAMADNPYGPYTFKGTILKEMNSITNHHSIVQYKGRWYLFYHNSDLYFSKHPEDNGSRGWDGVHPFRRSVCVDALYYNADGTILEVIPTRTGPSTPN